MKPILFNTEMVKAILANKKTQTRRPVKYIPALGNPSDWCSRKDSIDPTICDVSSFSPFGPAGTTLWVRETWTPTCFNHWPDLPHSQLGGQFVYYRASFDRSQPKWRPSIHMPRWAARIFLRVDKVWIERLQDIHQGHAASEGVNTCFYLGDAWKYGMTAKKGFENLWNSIYGNGEYSWDNNPWIWACEFIKIKGDRHVS